MIASTQKSDDRARKLLNEVIDAAIKYGVVADWFENMGTDARTWKINQDAMDLFTKTETQLRDAVSKYVLSCHSRPKVLQGIVPDSLLRKSGIRP